MKTLDDVYLYRPQSWRDKRRGIERGPIRNVTRIPKKLRRATSRRQFKKEGRRIRESLPPGEWKAFKQSTRKARIEINQFVTQELIAQRLMDALAAESRGIKPERLKHWRVVYLLPGSSNNRAARRKKAAEERKHVRLNTGSGSHSDHTHPSSSDDVAGHGSEPQDS